MGTPSQTSRRVRGSRLLALAVGLGRALLPSSVFSPGMAPASNRRQAARMYEGGKRTRFDADFMPRGLGPNALAAGTLDLLRARVRWLVDNNPLIAGARTTLVNNVIEAGIQVQPDTGIAELDDLIEERWAAFAEGVNPDRDQSLGDFQRQFLEELFSAGEVGVHDVIAEARVTAAGEFDRGPAVELIDAERLEIGYTDILANGNTVLQSVELDANLRRVAFHVRKSNPKDQVGGVRESLTGNERRRLPSDRFRLCFIPRRVGQLRGVPWPVATVADTRTESHYMEAYLMLARMAACVGLVFPEGDDDSVLPEGEGDAPGFRDASGNAITELEPGIIGYADKKPEVINANVPPPTMEMVERLLHQRLAAGLNMSYAVVSRNFKGTTFSASRAEKLEDIKHYRPIQKFVYWKSTLPLYRNWLWWQLTSGAIKLKPEWEATLGEDRERLLYNALPVYPGWDWVNPKQEADAAKIEHEIGIVSLQQLCASKGRDWKQVLRQRIKAELFEQQLREAMGVPAPATPAKPTTPTDAPADAPEPDPETGDELTPEETDE